MFGYDDMAAAGAGIVSGIAGLFAGDPMAKYRDEALKMYQGVNPQVNSRDVNDIQGTAFNKVDPTSRQAMMGALTGLQNKYAQGGMDAIDRGRSAEIQAQQAQQTKQNQQAVLQHARATGTLNSGRALASQLLGAQGAGAAAATQSARDAATAEQARMDSLKGISSVAGQIQGGDFTVANANDALNKFNKGLQTGNAERWQQAQQETVQNGLARAGGVAGIAGQKSQGPTGAQNAAGFANTMGHIGADVIKGNGWGGGGVRADNPKQGMGQDDAWSWGGG